MAVEIVRGAEGRVGYKVLAGGGMGRTPYIAHVMNEFVEREDILAYLEAVCASITRTAAATISTSSASRSRSMPSASRKCAARVDREFEEHQAHGQPAICRGRVGAHRRLFRAAGLRKPAGRDAPATPISRTGQRPTSIGIARPAMPSPPFRLKTPGQIPGDASAEQMEAIAASDGRIRPGRRSASATNRIWCCRMCARKTCLQIFARLKELDFASAQCRPDHRHHRLPGSGLLRSGQCALHSDCAGDRRDSSPISERQHEIGELKIKISGCINACGHHHAGHIGILGVDKKGVEFYQLMLGGSGAEDATIGEIMGPGFGEHEIADAVERVVNVYLKMRKPGERFLDTYRRLGMEPFKDAAYRERWRDQADQKRRLCRGPFYAGCLTRHELLPDGAVIVSLSRFQKERDALVARNAPIGVRLQSHENRRKAWATM